MTVAKPKLSYSLQEAAETTGLSLRSIRRAVDGKYLAVSYPPPIDKPVILLSTLLAWLESAPNERPTP